jgi:primosomal protein N'
MYILEVIPLSKSIRKEVLSYFSTKEVPVGSLVTIELRKRIVSGLVIRTKDGTNMKSEIKAGHFALKRVRGISKNTLFQKQFLVAAQRIAEYFATSTGSVLFALLPSKLLADISKLSAPHEQIEKRTTHEQTERYVMQDQFEERYASYKSLIRESFAHNQSVLFICPTSEDVLHTKALLTRGIEDHTFTFVGSMTTAQAVKTWNNAITHEKPVLIICTGNYLAIPRHDVGMIIVEKESSTAYRQQMMPYLDIRTCAELYASTIGASFLLADLALRTETLARYDAHELIDKGTLKFRSLTTADAKLINMKIKNVNGETPFHMFAPEVLDTIYEAHQDNEHTLLFTARRGLSPSIVCSDCGTMVSCTHCSAPMVLYGKEPTDGGNLFRCNVCGDERHAGEMCAHCNGWRLKTLGIGIETVHKEVAHLLPGAPIYILDSEHAKTSVQARAIIDAFYAQPGGILIATEMAIDYLREPVENIIVVSIDALLTLPDYAIRERVLRTLLRLRSRASKRFFISTRKAEDTLFEYARQGNLADFYREEFKDRKRFLYPPFVKLIKISLAGTPKATEDAMIAAQALLKPFSLLIYPAFTERQRGMVVWNGLLKLEPGQWPNEELRKKLMALPPQFKVLVDAPSLL